MERFTRFALSEETPEPGQLVLSVAGELDMATAPVLRERLEAATAQGATRIVVDLSEVTFIDSISLAALVAAKHKPGGAGRLAIVTEAPYALLILEATGLDSVLNVFPDRDAAFAFAFG
jgi:anti-anti-sigma factor